MLELLILEAYLEVLRNELVVIRVVLKQFKSRLKKLVDHLVESLY